MEFLSLWIFFTSGPKSNLCYKSELYSSVKRGFALLVLHTYLALLAHWCKLKVTNSITTIFMFVHIRIIYLMYINKLHKLFRFPNSRSHALRKVGPSTNAVWTASSTASGTGVSLDDLIVIVFAPRCCLAKSNVVNMFYCDYFIFWLYTLYYTFRQDVANFPG